jgi:hypothetical protein
MKKVFLLALLCSAVAAHAAAAGIALKSNFCKTYGGVSDFTASTVDPGNFASPKVIDGLSYYPPLPNISFQGRPVVAVFVANPNVADSDYGVTINSTAVAAEPLVRGGAAKIKPSQTGAAFVDIVCHGQPPQG